jgi:pSer/pThr/pTyr-binding forkhead associated (FHA) protein
MLRLIMRRGPTPGAIYELTAAAYSVGRGSKNDIVIRDNDVSREHCRLQRFVDDYEVYDLQSSTGTYVNGQRVVTKFVLQPGSILELGDMVTFEYERITEHVTPDHGLPPIPDSVPFEMATVPAPATMDDVPTQGRAPESSIDFHASLIMTHGPNVGQRYPLADLIVTIGRDLGSDVVVQDPEISRKHARLRRWRHGYSVEDIGSTNGTMINGQPVLQPQLLQPNDRLKVGTRVQFQYVQEANATSSIGGVLAPKPVPLDTRIAKGDTADLMFEAAYTGQIRPSIAGSGVEVGALIDNVFIAYAREEWESIVAPLTLSLQDAGLHVWVDQYLAQGSDDWRLAFEQALNECWLLVLVVSAPSLESSYVKTAYRTFLKRNKPIIPVVYGEGKLPAELGRARAITYDASGGRKSFHKLVFEIMQTRR